MKKTGKNNHITKFIAAAIAFCSLAGTAFGQVQVAAQIAENEPVYVGEPFTLAILIENSDQTGQVDISPLAEYNPQGPSVQDHSSRSIRIINGRRTENVQKRYVISYQLTAAEPGTINIPPLQVTVGQQNFTTEPLNINIIKPAQTDKLELLVELSEDSCYVGEAVKLTVRWFIFAEVESFNFSLPELNEDNFYIEDVAVDTTSGKALPPMTIGPGLEAVAVQMRSVRNGARCIELRFSKILIPKYAGNFVFDDMAVSADVATGRIIRQNRRRIDSFFDDFDLFGARKEYKRFIAIAEPVQLNVKPLPEQDKPVGFYGLVGNYKISANATPTKVNVGEPITLQIKISGSDYLEPVKMPKLEEIAAISENFKMSDTEVGVEVENGQKIFTQTIRANNANVKQIPAIPLPFFDTQQGLYVIAKTEPINIEVSPTRTVTVADALGGQGQPASGRRVERIRSGISANYYSEELLKDKKFSPAAIALNPAYALLWGGSLAVLVASRITHLMKTTKQTRHEKRRKRSAFANAKAEIKSLGTESQAKIQLGREMCNFIGTRFDRPPGSLTAEDCRKIITEKTGSNELANQYAEVIEQCQAAQYAPLDTQLDPETKRQVLEIIKQIDKLGSR